MFVSKYNSLFLKLENSAFDEVVAELKANKDLNLKDFLNAVDSNKNSPLHLAFFRGGKVFLEYVAKNIESSQRGTLYSDEFIGLLSKENRGGFTPLSRLFFQGASDEWVMESFGQILAAFSDKKHKKMIIESTNSDGFNIWHGLAKYKIGANAAEDIIKIINYNLPNYLTTPEGIAQFNKVLKNGSPLHIALSQGNIEFINDALEHFDNNRILFEADVLHFAAKLLSSTKEFIRDAAIVVLAQASKLNGFADFISSQKNGVTVCDILLKSANLESLLVRFSNENKESIFGEFVYSLSKLPKLDTNNSSEIRVLWNFAHANKEMEKMMIGIISEKVLLKSDVLKIFPDEMVKLRLGQLESDYIARVTKVDLSNIKDTISCLKDNSNLKKFEHIERRPDNFGNNLHKVLKEKVEGIFSQFTEMVGAAQDLKVLDNLVLNYKEVYREIFVQSLAYKYYNVTENESAQKSSQDFSFSDKIEEVDTLAALVKSNFDLAVTKLSEQLLVSSGTCLNDTMQYQNISAANGCLDAIKTLHFSNKLIDGLLEVATNYVAAHEYCDPLFLEDCKCFLVNESDTGAINIEV
ncbi:hypothetical protein Cyrtocomes_00156 [Candidatus Cyrtobacter comes]|uniref:Ankyrin repeat domain-containing protein n=1 Tax=Candidatus Cyrtobacter comes TaxID=675776 RepID=A0ABU5L6Q0_9RICK|nr:hypothetical protein [Candidatus Cyrtobacter comes]MDZ5761798.1 hypothetical protein [Candidatus Cyrtobacter comes]